MDAQQFIADLVKHWGGPIVLAAAFLLALYKGAQYVAGKWLEAKFASRLKATEQEFDRQMKQAEREHDVLVRQLQSSIDRELERASKLHAKEFDAIAEAWKLLHAAYWSTVSMVSPIQFSHDITQMTAAQREAFIEGAEELAPYAKAEIRALQSLPEQNDYYHNHLKWFTLNACFRKRLELVQFVDRHAIFMRPEIRAIFDRLQELIALALSEHQVNLHPARARQETTAAHNLTTAKPLVQELEGLIHKRLWSASPPESQAKA